MSNDYKLAPVLCCYCRPWCIHSHPILTLNHIHCRKKCLLSAVRSAQRPKMQGPVFHQCLLHGDPPHRSTHLSPVPSAWRLLCGDPQRFLPGDFTLAGLLVSMLSLNFSCTVAASWQSKAPLSNFSMKVSAVISFPEIPQKSIIKTFFP